MLLWSEFFVGDLLGWLMERYMLSLWVLGEKLWRSCQKERVICIFFFICVVPGDEEFS